MQSYQPGHAMHPIHARRLAETPWGWRPAIIRTVEDQTVTADYLFDEDSVTCWHAVRLADELEPGLPVRVHEEYHALEVEDSWINVRIEAGTGAVPEPENPDLWAGERPGAVVDIATGRGIRVSPEVIRRLRSQE